MTVLLDANVLIALVVDDHVHFDAAAEWLKEADVDFATCPITEGSLVRAILRGGQSVDTVRIALDSVLRNPRHEFWSEELSYRDVPLHGVIGHRQVTGAYLAQLARVHNGRLATFDRGLAKVHDDVAELVPTNTQR